MPFSKLDTAAVARTLSQIAEQPEDVVDAFFERREEVELPPEGEAGACGSGARRGSPCAWCREGHTWLASRDAIEARPFAEALRQVARAISAATLSGADAWRWRPPSRSRRPSCSTSPPPCRGPCGRTTWASRCAWPCAGTGAGCRWWGRAWCPGAESETFYSCAVESSWGRYGALLPRLSTPAAPPRTSPPPWWPCSAPARRRRPAPFRGPAVLAPRGGRRAAPRGGGPCAGGRHPGPGGQPRGGGGRRHGRALPRRAGRSGGGAAKGCAGPPTTRGRPSSAAGCCAAASSSSRWRTRCWARTSPVLLPGAGRRGTRHLPPGPRSSHLEILPGRRARGRSARRHAERGALPAGGEPRRARSALAASSPSISPTARRFRRGALAETVGPACCAAGWRTC